MKILLFAVLVFVALLLSSSYVHSTMDASGTPVLGDSSFCGSKCGARCSKAGVKDRCLKYCGICCLECKCVPSGTVGNKDECACYRDKKNSKGKSKCP